MIKEKDFAIFILTHGRANNVITVKSLQKHGYTGKYYLIIDNLDKQADEYYRIYGDKVQMFDKMAIAKKTDIALNKGNLKLNTITFARNACFDIAKKLGLKYFLQFDDDYTYFYYKTNNKYLYRESPLMSLDAVINAILEYYKSIPAETIAIAQNGDFIGGRASGVSNFRVNWKAMNSFFCKTDNPINFIGTFNEDVNTYTYNGSCGKIFFTVPMVSLQQKPSQSNKGGITELYLELGTYTKAFTTVMYCPAFVKIATISHDHIRIHHKINWKYAVPKILNPQYKKT